MIPTDFPWTGAARQLSARVHELALRSLCRRYVFVFLLAGGRHSAALSGQPAAAPMAIFELLDYIVIEVCAYNNLQLSTTKSPGSRPTLCTLYTYLYMMALGLQVSA